MTTKKDVAVRLWEKVAKGTSEECWLWQGSTSKDYGVIKDNGTQKYVHRVMWEITFGHIPTNLFVCHKCDNPPCVNPSHLFLGTARDNMIDKTVKGRNNAPKGVDHPGSKFTATELETIRQSSLSADMLATSYGVHVRTIYRILAWGLEKRSPGRPKKSGGK